MLARIYKPAKNAMTSGQGKAQRWVFEFEEQDRRRIEPLMGYTSQSDTMSQIRLQFDTKEEAIAYAERNEIPYVLFQPKEKKRRALSYSDNFRRDRAQPWTH